MWGHEFAFGSTVYLTESRQYHAATMASLIYSTKKEDSNTQPGTQLQFEGGAGGDFLKGGLTLGLSYYAAFKLSDDEIVTLCDYRAAMRRSRRRFEPVPTQFAPRGPAVTECPRSPDTRGGVFDYFWRSRDLTFGRHLEMVAKSLPARGKPIGVFVHGHSRLPDRSQSGANMISGGLLKIPMEGFSPVRRALTPIVINDGAWQRTITPVQLERLAADRGVPERELFSVLQPEDLAPCYSFVEIDLAAGAPVPATKYWRQSTAGDWSIAATCGR